MWKSFSGSITLLLLFGLRSCSGWGWHRKVDLREVPSLTLYHGQLTTSRRGPPVPQLKCVGGSAACEHTPKVVQCFNRGSFGNNVQWECKATMDERYTFGSMYVSCEGYNYPNDPYVLEGSCGLEYKLEYANGAAIDGWTIFWLIVIMLAIAFFIFVICVLPPGIENECGQGARGGRGVGCRHRSGCGHGCGGCSYGGCGYGGGCPMYFAPTPGPVMFSTTCASSGGGTCGTASRRTASRTGFANTTRR